MEFALQILSWWFALAFLLALFVGAGIRLADTLETRVVVPDDISSLVEGNEGGRDIRGV